ncbi:MAG: response regulator transcription factor [Gemmatimonadota bacterium]
MGIDRLTPRETEVLELIAEARSSPEIAAALGISVRTVEGHLCLVYRKLGVRNRMEAVRIWWEHENGVGA